MQKQVSKQSLAIIALSILLAISMALTATFAGFSDTKQISGSISFTGNVISKIDTTDLAGYEGVTVTNADTDSISFAASFNGVGQILQTAAVEANPEQSIEAAPAVYAALATVVGSIKIGLDPNSSNAYVGVQITIGDTNSVTGLLTWTAKTENVTDFDVLSADYVAYVSTNAFTGSTALVALSNFITTLTVDATKVANENDAINVTVKVIASSVKANIKVNNSHALVYDNN
jgi:hypothetical protein